RGDIKALENNGPCNDGSFLFSCPWCCAGQPDNANEINSAGYVGCTADWDNILRFYLDGPIKTTHNLPAKGDRMFNLKNTARTGLGLISIAAFLLSMEPQARAQGFMASSSVIAYRRRRLHGTRIGSGLTGSLGCWIGMLTMAVAIF